MSDRIAIDVGGTFTDVVRLDPAGALRFEKVPTTPSEPTRGVLAAFERARGTARSTRRCSPTARRSASTRCSTANRRPHRGRGTKGFRDVYLLGRTDRAGQLRHLLPQAAGAGRAGRHLRGARADAVRRLRAPALRRATRRGASPRLIRDRGYRSVAVAFLHSYANPDHEQAMRDVLREVAPDVEVSLSSRALPRVPRVRAHEHGGARRLHQADHPHLPARRSSDRLDESAASSAEFLMMRSGGGAMTARARPGPAGER